MPWDEAAREEVNTSSGDSGSFSRVALAVRRRDACSISRLRWPGDCGSAAPSCSFRQSSGSAWRMEDVKLIFSWDAIRLETVLSRSNRRNGERRRDAESNGALGLLLLATIAILSAAYKPHKGQNAMLAQRGCQNKI